MYKNYQLIQEIMNPDYIKSIRDEDLETFCMELRQELIDIISVTGGHIGVNLGILELTVALYRVFDFPKDSIIWDIGHQIYVQKMLTGRLPLLKEIRKNGGSPGYAYRPESEYEQVTSSHAGASLSLALGVAQAYKLKGKKQTSIAVIGDGSFVEGSNQEAFNHMAVEDLPLLYVLNDNEMALDNNFGGWHEYLKKITQSPKAENVFTELGMNYIGPIDGHNIHTLIKQLEDCKGSKQPIMLHVKTIKGKGLEQMANNSPVRIHWNFPFDQKTLENTEHPKSKSYAAAFSEGLAEIIEKDENVFIVTPATLQNTGIYGLSQKHPERVLDVGMAEQHAITFGGGLALEGVKPIVCFEATFLQRTYDQIVHDLCISDLPVLIVAARSGHTGLDHVTHHAMMDLSYLRTTPNLRVLYPATQSDLQACLIEETEKLNMPTLILFPYGGIIDDPEESIVIDRKLTGFTPSADTLILSVGMQNKNAEDVKTHLEETGMAVDHICLTQIAPLNKNLETLLANYSTIVTLEENILDGGIGTAILETINRDGGNANVYRYGFPKEYITHGTRDYIYKHFQLDAPTVAKDIIEKLNG